MGVWWCLAFEDLSWGLILACIGFVSSRSLGTHHFCKWFLLPMGCFRCSFLTSQPRKQEQEPPTPTTKLLVYLKKHILQHWYWGCGSFRKLSSLLGKLMCFWRTWYAVVVFSLFRDTQSLPELPELENSFDNGENAVPPAWLHQSLASQYLKHLGPKNCVNHRKCGLLQVNRIEHSAS